MEKLNIEFPTRVPDGLMTRSYPAADMDIRSQLQRLLVAKGIVNEIVPLEEVHHHLKTSDTEVISDVNNLTQEFYDTDDEFNETYLNILKYIHSEILQYDFVFQTTPTVRFHTPGRYSEVYRSKDDNYIGYHVDSFNGHPMEEINIWLPATKCFGTNTLRMAPLDAGVEALGRLLDDINYSPDVYYQSGWDLNFMKTNVDTAYRQFLDDNSAPIIIDHGEMVFFDPRCMHTSTDNTEETTRVSLDFRVISVDDYEKISTVRASQGRSGRKFEKGDVFHEKTIAELM